MRKQSPPPSHERLCSQYRVSVRNTTRVCMRTCAPGQAPRASVAGSPEKAAPNRSRDCIQPGHSGVPPVSRRAWATAGGTGPGGREARNMSPWGLATVVAAPSSGPGMLGGSECCPFVVLLLQGGAMASSGPCVPHNEASCRIIFYRQPLHP